MSSPRATHELRIGGTNLGWSRFAATAVTNGLTLVTCNDRDIAGLGAVVLNPFRAGETHRRSYIGDFQIARRTTGPIRRWRAMPDNDGH
jgi:hypothetical protein